MFKTFITNWNSSKEKLKSTKYLALMAAFIALKSIMSFMYIPVGENLHIGISYLIVSIEAIILGPAAGMVTAFVTDIVSFILMPDGPFFMGYTLTAMLGIFIYSCFFYEKQVTIWRIIAAKTINNYLVNVLLGSLWTAILYSKGYYYYFMKSLVKNTIMLPMEIVILYSMFQITLPFLEKRQLIQKQAQFHMVFKRKLKMKPTQL